MLAREVRHGHAIKAGGEFKPTYRRKKKPIGKLKLRRPARGNKRSNTRGRPVLKGEKKNASGPISLQKKLEKVSQKPRIS